MADAVALFRAAPKHRSDRAIVSADRVAPAIHGFDSTHKSGRFANLLGAIRAANAEVAPAIFVGSGTPFRTGSH